MEVERKFCLKVDSQCGEYNNEATLHMWFDEESRRAFYLWMAEGCKGRLAIDNKGCQYHRFESPKTQEVFEHIRKEMSDYPWTTDNKPYEPPYRVTCDTEAKK